MSSLTRKILESAPSGLTVTSPIPGSLNASWVSSRRVQYYRVYFDGVYVTDVTNPAWATSGLVPGSQHYVEVSSVSLSDGQEGPRSSKVFVTILADSIAPTAPPTLAFSAITDNSFIATWGIATDNVAVAGYEYSVAGGAYVDIGFVTQSVSVTGRAAGTAYLFSVRAYDTSGNRGQPITSTVTTTGTSSGGGSATTYVDISGSTSVSMFLAPLAGSFYYRVQYRVAGSGGAFTLARSYYVPWAVVSGLATNTAYEFQYAGEDEDGNLNTAWSSTFTGSTVANEPDLPEAPRSIIYTKYSPPVGGQLWTATNTANKNAAGTGTLSATGCGFQYALDNVRRGDIIELTAGATYVGPFNVKAKSGSGWIYIRTSNYAGLNAPNTRTSSAYASVMPKLVHATSDTRVVHVEQAGNVSFYRWVGIEIAPQGTNSYGLVDLWGDSNGNQINPANPCTDWTFDRCYMHAENSNTECGIGVLSDGLRIAHVDCYYDDFKGSALPGFLNQTEAKSLLFYGQKGPYKVSNCWLGAQGINIMFGGATPPTFSAADIPADIGVINNTFRSNQAYLTHPNAWQHKNLYEFKAGFRSVSYGNLFDTHWAQNQGSDWFLLTPRDQQYNPAGPFFPETQVTDLALVGNHAKNVAGGMSLSAGDDGDGVVRSSATTKRVLIQHLLHEMTNPINGGSTPYGYAYSVPPQNRGGIEDLIVRNWTLYNGIGLAGGTMQQTGDTSNAAKRNRFQYNIVSLGTYGFHDGVGGASNGNLNAMIPTFYDTNNSFTPNVLADNPNTGISPSGYPAGNVLPANQAAIGYVNGVAGGNFRLSASSPYKGTAPGGRDPGCNIDLIPA